MASKFEIFNGRNGKFYFHLKAGNGEIILSSQGYSLKAGCQKGVASVRSNAPDDKRYVRRDAVDGRPYFVLVAANGEIIGSSEMYSSAQARDHGIEAVQREAPNAPIEEISN